MDNHEPILHARDRILQAATHVYAELGFRGATTRRIAEEAGVNEVTLFRIFGSKSALLDEVLQAGSSQIPVTALPESPVDPARELTRWCAAHLAHLRAGRSLIRKVMSELEERPELAPCAGMGPTCAAAALREYLGQLRRAGLMPVGVDATSAVAMLLGTLFADAMGRDAWPNVFPQPVEAAPRHYTRLFLRAIGVADGRREQEAQQHARVKLQPTVSLKQSKAPQKIRQKVQGKSQKSPQRKSQQQVLQPGQHDKPAAGRRVSGRR